MSGSWPVLNACSGANWPTAGGFFAALFALAARRSSAHLIGSISAGHQFFGGALKKDRTGPDDEQQVDRDEVEDEREVRRMEPVAEDVDEGQRAVGEAAVHEPC